MNTDALRDFLIYCGREGYATMQEADEQTEPDQSTSITLTRGDRKFHDNYFGGEPFGGREVVFYQDKPIWIMTYYGRVIDQSSDASAIYSHLKKALAQVPVAAPYRGPESFTDGEWRYQNSWQGDIGAFSGEEAIYQAGQKVYIAQYVGGLVNKEF